MTYWATLWYAGAVVFQLGYEGQILNDCEMLRKMLDTDIQATYSDPEKSKELSTTMFPTNQFKTTCETEQMLPDEKYAK
jgi:hypothetical protein